MKKVIVSLGNPLKGDDNIANLVVDELSKQVKDSDYFFIKAQVTPENFVLKIKKQNPDIIYFIDAVDFKGNFGDVKLFGLGDIINMPASTHNIPITFFQKYFKNIKLVGIKVDKVDFGFGLSKVMEQEFDKILKKIKKLITSQ